MTTVEGTSVPRFRIQSRFLNDLRRRFGRIMMIFFIAVIPMFLFRACFLQYVEPDTIALRQISFGPSKGLQKELVTPGYRRAVTGYERIHAFPRDIQIVEFTNSSSESNDSHRMLPAINCPTVDGYPVAIDVSVLYRVADPFKLVSKFGFGRGYEDGVVIRFTDPAIKHYLGGLRAEEFYSEARLAKIQLAKKELAGRFKENGLELNDILIRQYDYPETFQTLTEQKKIQDQSVLTNIALGKQAEVQTRLNQTTAEGRNLISLSSAEFQAQITGLNAQRDLYERQKRAEADLLVRAAEAEGSESVNRAMQGPGSEKLLRLRKGLALLNAIKGPIYITDDPTDLARLAGGQ